MRMVKETEPPAFCISALFWTLLLISISASTANASDELQAQIPVVENSLDSTADGPHIFRDNDTIFKVFYLCHDSIIEKDYSQSDTLRFSGFCDDSGLTYLIPVERPADNTCVYSDVPRFLVVSDIHGEYEDLVEFFLNCGVIDENLRWNWGDGHLVIAGDIFDRGDRVTECLWLIYQLEMDSRKAGGRVHFLLGNHELMVLRGDDRYVNDKYLNGIVKKSRISHKDLYGPDMELGQWLRSLNTAIGLNDILIVHGGLSRQLVEKHYDLQKMNAIVRENIDLRSSQLAFNTEIKFLFGSKGPFWYRGYHYEVENLYSQAAAEEIDEILGHFGAKAVVVGHTEVDQVSVLFGGRVWAVDVPVQELGGFQGLFWEDGRFHRVSKTGAIEPIEED